MEVIRTARLILRTWRADDAPAFYRLNADPRVTEFLPGALTMEEVEAFIVFQQGLFARTGGCYFALEVESTRELAGFVGLKRHELDSPVRLPFAPCSDIGWRLAAPHWGKGYAIEGARACLNFGFHALGLDEIVSFTVPENRRSRAVMEKLGMREDTAGGFAHPALPPTHPLSRHVLYRLTRADAFKDRPREVG
ncbi:MAG TPA: GNAT family N-acetyltransferase [Noviherbaspirillum sp.]|jgi:RimJ/RimL family protein N-acetyltransferase|uniref:GNAT family N-acetyltransferase n=1 Tax=Noviherbaspirillum sp. TaxID=1926288 RepID=UPI002F92C639